MKYEEKKYISAIGRRTTPIAISVRKEEKANLTMLTVSRLSSHSCAVLTKMLT